MEETAKEMERRPNRMLSTVCAHRARDICDGASCIDDQCKVLRGGTEHQRHIIVPVRKENKGSSKAIEQSIVLHMLIARIVVQKQ